MVECKNLDPTALGLFLVAVVSLALGLGLLLEVGDAVGPGGDFFVFMGVLILFVAYFAYRAESQFGFTVFALVGAAVALTGYGGADGGMGAYGNLAFAIVFLLSIIWSLIAKTPKLLSLILVTTTLVFLIVALTPMVDADLSKALGIFALLNGIFALYLAFALALESKLPVV